MLLNSKSNLRKKIDPKGGISELSGRTGIPRPSLSRFFSSSSMPRRTTLFKIAKALNLPESSISFKWLQSSYGSQLACLNETSTARKQSLQWRLPAPSRPLAGQGSPLSHQNASILNAPYHLLNIFIGMSEYQAYKPKHLS